MERFAVFLQNEKQLSDATVNSYIRDIKLFSKHLNKEAAKATKEDVEGFFKHLQSIGRSPSTVARFYSSLHTYFAYLCEKGKLREDPTVLIPRPEIHRRIPIILTKEEVASLLLATEGSTPKSLRDRAMLELLYATGLRVSELLDLRVDHINLRRRMLSFRTGGHRRTIPVGRPAASALSEYLKSGRPYLLKKNVTAHLFLSLDGEKMSRQGFWKLVKHYKKAAGIDKEITPHTLRHSFAAHLLENGADLSAVQEMMGFSDPASIAVYTKIIEDKIMDIYDKSHPRAN